MLNKLRLRFRALFFRSKMENELEEEVRFHLEREIEENLARGMSPEEARSAAMRNFGGVEQIREQCRDERGIRFLEEVWQDLRYGFRTLRKNPGFTAIAVLTLALGIGANTAVFTLINSVLLRTLPVPNPHELIVINDPMRGKSSMISFPMYRDLRARQEVFTDILASTSEWPVRLTIPSGAGSVEVDNVQTRFVTANYFPLLGVQPTIGRFFTEDEDRNPNSSETAGSLAVISYAFWERQFGRDPGVLNRTVFVNRSPCQVIGVTPRGFYGEVVGNETDVWVPLISFSPRNYLENRGGMFTRYMGRLKPGISRHQAQTAMTILFQQLVQAERTQSTTNSLNRAAIQNFTILLQPAATGFDYGVRSTFTAPLWIIMAIVALVLLIACANVANLLLARAASRQREIGVRLALGCSRQRLVRQLLTESVLLSSLGTVAGLVVAYWGSHVLLRMLSAGSSPLSLDLRPDARVLVFMAAVAVLTGFGFGLTPAWRASSLDLVSALKDQARGGTSRHLKRYLGRTLVVFQVALSLLLLIGASLLIRSLQNLRQIDLGFRPEQVLMFDLAHNPQKRDPAALARIAREVYDRVIQIPGV
jgi:predicted permease